MKKLLIFFLTIASLHVSKAAEYNVSVQGLDIYLITNQPGGVPLGSLNLIFNYTGPDPTGITGAPGFTTGYNPSVGIGGGLNPGQFFIFFQVGPGTLINTTYTKIATITGPTSFAFAVGDVNNTVVEPSPFTEITYNGLILPLEWLSFKATPITNDGANKVALAWETASEKDVVDFNVERSDDGKVFTKIGAAIPATNKVTKSSYTAYDDKPLTGVSYYRIRQTDTDGKTTVTKIESVTLNSKKAVGKFTFYPNPIQKGTPLSILTDVQGGYDFKVIDMTGRVMYNQKLQGSTELKGLNLAGGTYLYEILSGEQRVSGKIFVAE